VVYLKVKFETDTLQLSNSFCLQLMSWSDVI